MTYEFLENLKEYMEDQLSEFYASSCVLWYILEGHIF